MLFSYIQPRLSAPRRCPARRPSVPAHRLGVVLRHPAAAMAYIRPRRVCRGLALLGGLAEPAHRLGVVPRQPSTALRVQMPSCSPRRRPARRPYETSAPPRPRPCARPRGPSGTSPRLNCAKASPCSAAPRSRATSSGSSRTSEAGILEACADETVRGWTGALPSSSPFSPSAARAGSARRMAGMGAGGPELLG